MLVPRFLLFPVVLLLLQSQGVYCGPQPLTPSPTPEKTESPTTSDGRVPTSSPTVLKTEFPTSSNGSTFDGPNTTTPTPSNVTESPGDRNITTGLLPTEGPTFIDPPPTTGIPEGISPTKRPTTPGGNDDNQDTQSTTNFGIPSDVVIASIGGVVVVLIGTSFVAHNARKRKYLSEPRSSMNAKFPKVMEGTSRPELQQHQGDFGGQGGGLFDYSSSSLPQSTSIDHVLETVGDVLDLRFSTELFEKYYRNERNNIQCFPKCKEWGEYSIGKLAGREHQKFKRGACAGEIHASAFIRFPIMKCEPDEAFVFLGRIGCDRTDAPPEVGKVLSESEIDNLLSAKDNMFIKASSEYQPQTGSEGAPQALHLCFHAPSQWRYCGRIRKNTQFKFQIVALSRVERPHSAKRSNASSLTIEMLDFVDQDDKEQDNSFSFVSDPLDLPIEEPRMSLGSLPSEFNIPLYEPAKQELVMDSQQPMGDQQPVGNSSNLPLSTSVLATETITSGSSPVAVDFSLSLPVPEQESIFPSENVQMPEQFFPLPHEGDGIMGEALQQQDALYVPCDSPHRNDWFDRPSQIPPTRAGGSNNMSQERATSFDIRSFGDDLSIPLTTEFSNSKSEERETEFRVCAVFYSSGFQLATAKSLKAPASASIGTSAASVSSAGRSTPDYSPGDDFEYAIMET